MKSRIFKPPQGEVSTKDILDIINSQKNIADGIAGLDSNALVNLANLPLIPASQLDFSFAWEKVAEVEATAAVAEIDVTGLAGDTDLWYMLLYEHIPVSSTSKVDTFIIFNKDTVVGNYCWAGFGVSSAGTWGGSYQAFGSTSGSPGLPFIQNYAGENSGIGVAFINTRRRTVGTKSYVTAIGLEGVQHGWMISCCLYEASAEITTISIYCPEGAYINSGSKVYLFKPKW